MTILYFTSTGNCLHVAKRIGGDLISIPQLQKQNKYNISDEAVGIVSPIYGCDVPRPVRSYLGKVKIDAKYVFAIMTYGDQSMGAVTMMKKLLESRGITLNYSNEIDMVDNYLPGYEVSKQLKMKKDADIEESINKIVQDINSRKNALLQKDVMSKLISVCLSSAYVSALGKKVMNGSSKRFLITDACSSCGICRKVCPMGNIVGTGEPEYLQRCEFCLACTHLCPQNAIRLKGEKSVTRFRNKNISLAEIIAANEQI